MNRFTRAILSATPLLAFAASTFAQGWALPAKTPETPVSCATCPDASAGAKTVGYKLPISTFTGRFLDSSSTSEWFAPYRTARADEVRVMPALNRIYFRIGNGSIGAYSLSGFFSRLEAGEPLVFAFGTNPGDRTTPEVFLRWDEWINPEKGGGWRTFNVDGSERISSFDVDDQGYVYVAATIWGWGICKDSMTTGSSSLMNMQYQAYPPKDTTAMIASRIVAVKGSGSRYYAIVSNVSQSQMWDVTIRTKPTRVTATSPTIRSFAKTTSGDRVAIIDSQSRLSIGGGDDFVSGNPLFTGTGYSVITSDGTNFYAVQGTPSGNVITVIVPSGNSYVVQGSYPMAGALDVSAIHYGDGFLVVSGNEYSGWDFRVYKVSNLKPAALTINATPADPAYPSYFRNYYSNGPVGFIAPGYVNSIDGVVYHSPSNGKSYLVICAKGIGDVYELQGGDSVAVTTDGRAGTSNPHAPLSSNSTVFYGDKVQFTAKSSSTSLSTVVWNFGNPEAGLGANTQQTSAINSPIVYQYSNLLKTGLGQRTVSASSINDSSVRGTSTVTLASPAVRIGVNAAKFLFTQPNASSAAPIVSGDTFVDSSDGTVEGHYSSWTIDGLVSKLLPSQAISAGTCGTHSVALTGFYGPYTGTGDATFTSSSIFDVNLGTVNYGVRPFAASIDPPTSDASSLTFTSSSRFSSDFSLLDLGHTNNMTWKWELLDGSGTFSRAGPNGTGVSILPFAVSKTAITSAGMRVRLTITSPDFIGACAGMVSSVALSLPLNSPTYTLSAPSSCNNGPCTFSATPVGGIDPVADGWTYSWSVPGALLGSYSAPGGTIGSTFTPTFTKAGTYTIQVIVGNAITTSQQQVTTVVTNPASACPKMDANSFSIAYSGGSCNSLPSSAACTSGDRITFVAFVGSTYKPDCAPHTYSWTFPDNATPVGGTVDDAQVVHAVTVGGTISLLVTNTLTGDSLIFTKTISVGTIGPPPPPPPPPPPSGGCGTMTALNVQPTWSGASCPNGGGTCGTNDLITFNVQPYQYSFSCGYHTFSWKFDDNTTATTQQTTHTFTSGPQKIVLTVTNPSGSSVTKTINLTISPSSGGGGGSCGTMTNNTIFLSYNGSSCSTGQNCKNGDNLTFDVQGSGYDLNCAQHTFDWDFGDGSAHANSKSPAHTFNNAGPHTVTLTINNGSQNFQRAISFQTTSSGSGSCGTITPNVSLSINYANSNNTCGPLGGDCAAGEVVNFTVLAFGSYDLGCATHTFDWDFGDGSPHASSKDATHQYSAQGTYNAKCTVSNGSQTVTLTQPVKVKGNSPVVSQVEVSYIAAPLQGVPNGFLFTPSFDHPEMVKSWQWDFGDGTKSPLRTGTLLPEPKVYADSKQYTVVLTAYDSQGQPLGVATHPGVGRRRSVRH